MNIKIAVLPGDGIGPEIIAQALEVTKAVCNKFGHTLDYKKGLVGACAIDATGNPYPDETHELCMQSDAVLFGAVGDLRFDNNPSAKVRPEQGLLAMRKKLGLYANLRPVTTFESLIDKSPLRPAIVRGADFMCIRELTGGLYFGRPQGRSEDGNTAYDTCVYTREEVERIVKLAYEYAMKRRKKVTVVDKANVLATSRLWREVAGEIAKQYPEVLFVTATGKDYYKEYSEKYRAAGLDTCPNVRVFEYIYDMPVQMAAADVVISRAGAMTLSELALMRKCAVLIPSPNVANDHQYKNAKALGDAGAAVYARESEFANGGLQARVQELLADAHKRAEMRRTIATFARADANALVLAEVEQLLSRKEGRA